LKRMPNERSAQAPECRTERGRQSQQTWAKPSFEVIPLDCEITAYAPDGDSPLF